MTVTQLAGALTSGVTGTERERIAIKKASKPFASKTSIQFRNEDYLTASYRRKLSSNNFARRCGLIDAQQTADYALIPSDVEESDLMGSYATTSPLRVQSVQTELIMLSLPAIAGQAIEPLAQLMETAYIGRIGPLELASAGVSISIFNIMSKVFNIPLLSIATSFVAEDISRNENKESTSDGGSQNRSTNGSPLNEMGERKMLPSVSTALLLAIGIGILEALAMYFGSGPFLSMMGISSASSMRGPAQQFLKLRAVGAPAVVLYLAIQGILRGFKDTKTPVLCLGLGNLSAVFLFPLLMYRFRLGVTGAAISTIVSQYIVAFLMIWYLNKRTVLFQSHMKSLHFGGYLRSGGFLLGRTLAAVMTITLSTSMAARLGPLAMAAHQICLQVWLSVALLADAQAASGQALIARSFTKRDYSTVKKVAYFALQGGLLLGFP
ncbi:hypothetical protein L1049_001769 [Liquidambar formosana]|uniref:Protein DETOXIFICATION n=1 Tax=Liquidambar formosana TaxID=63359 RepID=A0AAP0N6A7_LIQFO